MTPRVPPARHMFKNWRYLDQTMVEQMVFDYFRDSY